VGTERDEVADTYDENNLDNTSKCVPTGNLLNMCKRVAASISSVCTPVLTLVLLESDEGDPAECTWCKL